MGASGAIADIRLYGGGQIVNFNNTVSWSGRDVGIATSGTGNTVNINGSFTADNFSVINGGTLNLNSAGSLNAAVRLGVDYIGSGNVNNASGASFNLTAAAGGQTFSSVINSAGGNLGSLAANTSGALTVNSQNTTNANTLSGHIALDSPLNITQSAGGTLNITQGRSSGSNTSSGTDVKAKTLTFSGAGNFVVGATTPTGFGTIYDSASGGSGTAIIMSGTGSLSLNDANSYRGKTEIDSGTLFVGANNALGTSNGTIGTKGNDILLGKTSGSANANLLTTGAFHIMNVYHASKWKYWNDDDWRRHLQCIDLFTVQLSLARERDRRESATFVAFSGGTVDFQGAIDEKHIAYDGKRTVAIGDSTHTGTVKFSNTSSGLRRYDDDYRRSYT